ncbi:hypothetical protein F4802DRAFT_588585 [Xylaria palmicola]|nr:hypothetical protein F4802DRAFT_588585 [Xylaria palmicola]
MLTCCRCPGRFGPSIISNKDVATADIGVTSLSQPYGICLYTMPNGSLVTISGASSGLSSRPARQDYQGYASQLTRDGGCGWVCVLAQFIINDFTWGALGHDICRAEI